MGYENYVFIKQVKKLFKTYKKSRFIFVFVYKNHSIYIEYKNFAQLLLAHIMGCLTTALC